MSAIEITNLVKMFDGLAALDKLNISVPEGSVFGFIGPNGAGKTTTTRILVGLAKPTSGSVKVLGRDVTGDNNREIKRLIGYLPDVPAFYNWMKPVEYLTFAGEMYGIKRPELRKRVSTLLEASGLSDVDRRIGGFSRGMKQRLGIAQSLINDPEILFLDEPTSALDPIGRKEVLEMINALSKKKTVFFSTHILADVERVCDRVAIIDKGRLVAEGQLGELKKKYLNPVFIIQLDADAGILKDKLTKISWVSSVQESEEGLKITVSDTQKAQMKLASVVSESGLPLRRLVFKEAELEDIFVNLVKK